MAKYHGVLQDLDANELYPKMDYQLIVSENKSYSVTANTWTKSTVSFTVSKRGLYHFSTVYSSGATLGFAVVPSSASSVNYAQAMWERTTTTAFRGMCVLEPNTYAIWFKTNSTTFYNTIAVYRMCDVG